MRVLLKCHKPVDQIITVARDAASGTSTSWSSCEHHFGVSVEMVVTASTPMLVTFRIDSRVSRQRGNIDLAAAWKMLTNLPFVFALWAMQPDANEVKQIDA